MRPDNVNTDRQAIDLLFAEKCSCVVRNGDTIRIFRERGVRDLRRLSADVNLTHFNASNPGEIAAPVFDNDSRIMRGMASVSLENSCDRTSGALKFFYNWDRHRINDGCDAGENLLAERYEINAGYPMPRATVFGGVKLNL